MSCRHRWWNCRERPRAQLWAFYNGVTITKFQVHSRSVLHPCQPLEYWRFDDYLYYRLTTFFMRISSMVGPLTFTFLGSFKALPQAFPFVSTLAGWWSLCNTFRSARIRSHSTSAGCSRGSVWVVRSRSKEPNNVPYIRIPQRMPLLESRRGTR